MAGSVYQFVSLISVVTAINQLYVILQINSSVFSYIPDFISRL